MLTKIIDAEDTRFIILWTFVAVLLGMTFGQGKLKLHYLIIGGLIANTVMTLIFKWIIRPLMRKQKT